MFVPKSGITRCMGVVLGVFDGNENGILGRAKTGGFIRTGVPGLLD